MVPYLLNAPLFWVRSPMITSGPELCGLHCAMQGRAVAKSEAAKVALTKTKSFIRPISNLLAMRPGVGEHLRSIYKRNRRHRNGDLSNNRHFGMLERADVSNAAVFALMTPKLRSYFRPRSGGNRFRTSARSRGA